MRIRVVRHAVAVTGLVLGLFMFSGVAPDAQLAAPGASGVVMGHLHLATKDIEASRRFWAAMGGVPVQNGQLQLIQLPGTFVMLRPSQQPSGGTEGSTVERVALRVKASDMAQLTERLEQALGSKFPFPMVTSPEGVTIELRSSSTQNEPIRLERLDFKTVAPGETRDWYVKIFGATPSALPTQGTPQTYIAELPGLLMYFRKADAAPAGTRGRGLDHIGFEVKNLEEFCRTLEAAGQKFDRPYGRLPNSTTAIAFLTDAWGTYIELTENLAPPK